MAVAPRYQLYSVENDTVAFGSFLVAYKKLLPPDRPRGTKIVELPLHPAPRQWMLILDCVKRKVKSARPYISIMTRNRGAPTYSGALTKREQCRFA